MTEACNTKWSSKFVREYRVLHSILRNLMLLFMKSISLCNPIKLSAILYPKSLANMVVEVGTRHNHQILLHGRLKCEESWSHVVKWFVYLSRDFTQVSYCKSCHHDGCMAWKQLPDYWPFVREIRRSSVDSPHEGQVMRRLAVFFVGRLNTLLI